MKYVGCAWKGKIFLIYESVELVLESKGTPYAAIRRDDVISIIYFAVFTFAVLAQTKKGWRCFINTSYLYFYEAEIVNWKANLYIWTPSSSLYMFSWKLSPQVCRSEGKFFILKKCRIKLNFIFMTNFETAYVPWCLRYFIKVVALFRTTLTIFFWP